MTDYNTWRREVRELAMPLRPEMIEWQVDQKFLIVTLSSIVRVES